MLVQEPRKLLPVALVQEPRKLLPVLVLEAS